MIAILSAVLSGIVATIITLKVTYRNEQLKCKRALAADLFGYRYQLLSDIQNTELGDDGFQCAMNRVPIIFSGDEEVMSAYDQLFRIVIEPDPRMQGVDKDMALLNFLKAICKSSRIKCEKWNEDRIKKVFKIK